MGGIAPIVAGGVIGAAAGKAVETALPPHPGHLPGTEHDPVQYLAEQLARQLPVTLAQEMARRNPTFIADEYNQVNAATSVEVEPKSRNAERITGLLAVSPITGVTSATLQIGTRQIPVQNSTLLWTDLDWLLLPSERRILTIAGTTGTLFLWLWGYEQPSTYPTV